MLPNNVLQAQVIATGLWGEGECGVTIIIVW